MNNEIIFFIPDYQFQKVIFMFPWVIIFLLSVEAPLVVEALGNCPVCPPLNPALVIQLMWRDQHL